MVRVKRLFEPIKIGNLELKNRIKMPAMSVVPPGPEDTVIPRLKAFYTERAKGGVSLIGVSCTATKLIQDPMLGLYDDRFIKGLRELTESIHAHGAKTYAQMGVGYSWAFDHGPVELVGPSISLSGRPGTPFRLGGPLEPTMPRALTVGDIHQIADGFGEGARRALEAGFDAVEIIASVGYLIAQFLSPLTNKRTDEYGGNLENRMRFLLEIIENMKKKTGHGLAYTCRLSGADLLDGGYTLEDTAEMAQILEKAGIHEIDIMSGWHNASVPIIQTGVAQGAWAYMAEAVKKAVKIPIAAGTQIQDIMVAEKLLRQGKADLVYMARALIADPELPNKAKEGRLADIRPCITCCRCVEAVDEPPVYCTVNARAGREWDYPLETPAAKQKRVLVVGGGPSGIEAARLAAVRGHRTTLIDQGPRLGGNLILASIANRRIEMLVKYLVRQVRKLTVELRLNTKVTPALIESIKPDAVVLAAGGVYPKLELPGINSNKVIGGNDIKQLVNGSVSKRGLMWRLGSIFMRYFYNPTLVRWALRFNFPIKKRVVIIGGWFASCELADTLAGKGKQVIILEKSGRIGYDIGITHRWVVMRRLRGFGVRMETNAEPLEIIDKGVKAKLGDTEEVIPADSVVLTDKLQPNTELACRMEDKALMFYQIGDCAEPAKIMEALVSGFRVGNEI